MSELSSTDARPSPPAGLCGACLHSRRIETRSGNVFRLCERSTTDPRFARYPGLPVLTCLGFEAVSRSDRRTTDRA